MQNQYNLARAQQSYKSLVQIHEKNGECVLSPVSYGGLTLFTETKSSHASKLRKIGAWAVVNAPNTDSNYMHVIHIITLTVYICYRDFKGFILKWYTEDNQYVST